MYKEIEDIDFVVYCSISDGIWHIADLRDRELKDGNGNPWYEGVYENCLIALNYQRITNKLYFCTKDIFSQFTYKDLKNVKILENRATRIKTR